MTAAQLRCNSCAATAPLRYYIAKDPLGDYVAFA
jgi:hypothetical protein